jgi:ADP-ribose pyrophosphatase
LSNENSSGLTATIVSSTRLSDGFIKLERVEFDTAMHSGGRQRVIREIMDRGHAVGVLGYDAERDEVVLINEFRPGCLVAGDPAYTDNIVAGGMTADESPLEAAVREMHEETGLELRDPVLAHPGAYVSSGGSTEKIAIVVGFVDTSAAGGVHGNAEESEDILTVVVPWQEFMQRVRDAQITDLKTLVAAYWLAEHRGQLRMQRTHR